MKLIIGLGNPGKAYEYTRHNMGFMTLEKVAALLNVKFKTKECKALTAVLSVEGEKVVLALPETYMNLSGESVKELMGKYGATVDDLVVVFDDIDLPLGHLRLRTEGSGGTHNGMKNIIENIGGKNFKRIRLGIGEERGEIPLRDFVLGRVQGEEKDVVEAMTMLAAKAVIEYIKTGDFEKIMRECNNN